MVWPRVVRCIPVDVPVKQTARISIEWMARCFSEAWAPIQIIYYYILLLLLSSRTENAPFSFTHSLTHSMRSHSFIHSFIYSFIWKSTHRRPIQSIYSQVVNRRCFCCRLRPFTAHATMYHEPVIDRNINKKRDDRWKKWLEYLGFWATVLCNKLATHSFDTSNIIAQCQTLGKTYVPIFCLDPFRLADVQQLKSNLSVWLTVDRKWNENRVIWVQQIHLIQFTSNRSTQK